MSFSKVGAGATYDNGGAPWISTNLAKDTGTAAGDFAIIILSYYENTQTAAPTIAGFTLRASSALSGTLGSGSASAMRVFTRNCDGTEGDNYVPTFAGGIFGTVILTTLRGTNALSFVSAAVGTAGNGTSATAPSVSGTAGQGLIGAFGLGDPGGTYTPPSGMTLGTTPAENTNTGRIYYQDLVATEATGTRVLSFTNTRDANGVSILVNGAGVGIESEQEGHQFRNDDGSESTATAAAAQDANVSRAVAQAVRLRILINGTGNLPSAQYRLDYKLSTDSVYVPVPVAAAASVTYGDAGTASAGTTSVTPAYPTGISAATSKLFCVVTGRSSVAGTAPTMPAGWTAVLDFEGGAGTYGVDTGTRRVTVFQKDTVEGTETGTVTVSFSSGNTQSTLRAIIFRFEIPAGFTFTVEATTGADTSHDVSYSATGSSTLNLIPNDLLMIATAQNVDTGTQSSQSITAAGITFGSRANRATAPVTGGNDHRQIVETIPVNSGSATVAPAYSYTASEAVSGPTGFLRMRAVPPPIQLSLSSNIAASGENTTAQLAAPSGKTTSDFVAGRIQDDENPADAVDITADDYTELEWCLAASSTATNGQVYQFRVTIGGTTLSTYTVTPQLTIGSAGAELAGAASAVAAASGNLSTQIRLAAVASGAAAATAALTTQIPLGANAASVAASSASLTTAIRLAAAAVSQAAASGALTAGTGQLQAAASSVVTATAALATGIQMNAAAAGQADAAAALTEWATVTLTSPLYTGQGGVLDPNFWVDAIPDVGDTLYYDDTHIIIAENGEISSDTNNCTAVVQFFDGADWAFGLIVITPQLAAVASASSTASAQLSTAINLAAAASALATATGALSIGAGFAATAVVEASASGDLTTGIPLMAEMVNEAVASADLTVAAGLSAQAAAQAFATAALTTSVDMRGDAAAEAVATGLLTTQILLGALAQNVVNATAALVTQIHLAAVAASQATATADFTSAAILNATAQSLSTMSASLTTGIRMAGAAAGEASAAGVLSTGIPLSGAAQVAADAIGSLSTIISLQAAVVSQTDASADLSVPRELVAAAINAVTAGAILTTGIQVEAHAASITNASAILGSEVDIFANALSTVGATANLILLRKTGRKSIRVLQNRSTGVILLR